MKPIKIPESYNYIAAFLTLGCNYRCSYCINYFNSGNFIKGHISGQDWVKGLNRIISRDDLPVTLQGGEPSIHRDFIYIINNIESRLNVDVLTNLQFDVDDFIRQVDPKRLRRNSPYASIRVSYHPEVMDLENVIAKVLRMMKAGFSMGIWGVLYPAQKAVILEAQERCERLGIDFRTKEFLGEYNSSLHGTYRYEGACDKKFKKRARCKTTEFITGSDGSIYRCHADLYEGRQPIGSILDPDFEIEDKFRSCSLFGHCNPCDIKVKTNRLQQFGHTSVEIRDIEDLTEAEKR